MGKLALVGLIAVACTDTSLYVHEEYLAHVRTQVIYPPGHSEAMLQIQNTGARPIALEAPLYLFSDRTTDKSCPSPELALTETRSIGPRATVQVPIIGDDSGKFVGVCFWVAGAKDASVYARTDIRRPHWAHSGGPSRLHLVQRSGCDDGLTVNSHMLAVDKLSRIYRVIVITETRSYLSI